jgi:hypothetical protein
LTDHFTRAAIRTAAIAVLVLGCAFLSTACHEPPGKPSDPEVAWRPLGSWSGRGNRQTESFTSDSGSLRVQWTTAGETKAGEGTFHLTIHSAISGRPLKDAVDERGVGTGTAFVQEDPRVFFAVVDSADLEWSFTLEEAVLVERKGP